MGKALAVVSLVEDDQVLPALFHGLKKIDGGLPIVAATESPARFEKLHSMGVEQAFIKNQSTLIVLYEALLQSLKFDDARVGAVLTAPCTSFNRRDCSRKWIFGIRA
jgi:hypothetical protein